MSHNSLNKHLAKICELVWTAQFLGQYWHYKSSKPVIVHSAFGYCVEITAAQFDEPVNVMSSPAMVHHVCLTGTSGRLRLAGLARMSSVSVTVDGP